ncbi:hypothetical protein C0992_005829 [Termitomyces sp. T32_za158]|nr:hypothetical protein C0992_005829 [Termitomyces sp. T32_za158]
MALIYHRQLTKWGEPLGAPVLSIAEKPDLKVPQSKLKEPEPPIHSRDVKVSSPVEEIIQSSKASHAQDGGSLKPPIPDDDGSATEESDGDDSVIDEKLPTTTSQLPPNLTQPKSVSRTVSLTSVPAVSGKHESETDSSPARPVKKPKQTAPDTSSDSDSEEERKRRVAQLKGGSGGGGKRGTRQPIKRGGKRF